MKWYNIAILSNINQGVNTSQAAQSLSEESGSSVKTWTKLGRQIKAFNVIHTSKIG